MLWMPRFAARRLLSSPLIDVLVGPHGIDRYLELIRPASTVHDARASVQAVRRQTARSVTLTLRPNTAFQGFRAGQFVRVGVEIDGIRRTRTYSPACSERAGLLELTVTAHPDGLVSHWLREQLAPGAIVHLGEASGSFVLPNPRPERLALISGGSGITPVLSMLRTLCEEGFDGELAFVHYARTRADWLYRLEAEAMAARHPGIQVAYMATREGDRHASAESLRQLIGDLDGATAMVCGPSSLIDGVRAFWPGELCSETFTPPSLKLARDGERPAEGTIRFQRSGLSAAIASGSLLEQAETAGLSPEFGCRMGICHTCTCRKTAGAVRDLRTGEVSEEEDEDIQLCVSVPVGNVALEI
jgi:stearoyl-CoA 9-desaturase NADPH oxidoreductase